MQTIPEIGTKIWANIVRPGCVIRTDQSEHNMPVARVTENYNTFTFDDGNCHAVTVDYAALVEVVGYYNPDPPEELRPRQDWWTA